VNICLYRNETIVLFVADDDLSEDGVGGTVLAFGVTVVVVVVVADEITVADGSGAMIGIETTEIVVIFVKYAGR